MLRRRGQPYASLGRTVAYSRPRPFSSSRTARITLLLLCVVAASPTTSILLRGRGQPDLQILKALSALRMLFVLSRSRVVAGRGGTHT